MSDFIHTLWNYNIWGHGQLWQCLQTVSEEDFKAHVDYSNGSLHVHTVHLMWAEDVWYNRLHDTPRPTYTPKDYPTRAGIREKWDSVQQKWQTYLNNLSPTDLERRIDIVPFTGNPYSGTVADLVLHVVNHGTNHRAQMLRLIHDAGGQTFEQDVSHYLRVRSAD